MTELSCARNGGGRVPPSRPGLVSIIMPAYNASRFINEAVGSVLAQTWQDWELIIIDDGSTDDTPEILAQLDDARIKVIRQANGGVSAARNAGLDAATGEFVTFLDADDLLPRDALKSRSEYLEANPGVDIVNGDIRVTDAGSLVRNYDASKAVGRFFPRIARLDEAVFFGTVYMIRRACIGGRRFPVGVSHCEDLIFFLELAHDADLTYGAVDAEVYEYRQHANSAMTDLAGLEAGYLTLLRHASRLNRMTPDMMRYLKSKVASILLKSWLRRGRPLKAMRAYVSAMAIGRAARA